MRTVTATELRAEKGTTEHAFSSQIARIRNSSQPVQITRQTGAPNERTPAVLVSYDQTWTPLTTKHHPKQVQEWGARYARTHLRHLLDDALQGVHTVITVDGIPYAAFVPTQWYQRVTAPSP